MNHQYFCNQSKNTYLCTLALSLLNGFLTTFLTKKIFNGLAFCVHSLSIQAHLILIRIIINPRQIFNDFLYFSIFGPLHRQITISISKRKYVNDFFESAWFAQITPVKTIFIHFLITNIYIPTRSQMVLWSHVVIYNCQIVTSFRNFPIFGFFIFPKNLLNRPYIDSCNCTVLF